MNLKFVCMCASRSSLLARSTHQNAQNNKLHWLWSTLVQSLLLCIFYKNLILSLQTTVLVISYYQVKWIRIASIQDVLCRSIRTILILLVIYSLNFEMFSESVFRLVCKSKIGETVVDSARHSFSRRRALAHQLFAKYLFDE